MNKTSLFSLRSAAVIITAAVLLLLCACAPAASPRPEASVCATAQTPIAEYSFKGDNARTAGYACGTIRLTQPQNAPRGGVFKRGNIRNRSHVIALAFHYLGRAGGG